MRIIDFLIKKIKKFLELRKIQQEIREIEEKREEVKEKKQEILRLREAKAKKKRQERKNWEEAKRFKEKQNHQLILDIEKNRDKINTEKKFNTPIIKQKNYGAEILFKGEKFLLCYEGFSMFKNHFKNDEYYTIIIKDGYLARQHKEKGFIQFFHRWLMRREVSEFCYENDLEKNEVEVHHIDLTRTNDKKENLKPLPKDEHKKLHIRLKFSGSDEEYEDWYDDNIND